MGARRRASLCPFLRIDALSRSRSHRRPAAWLGLRLGHAHRRRGDWWPICSICVRHQRLLGADAPRPAHRCADGYGDKHEAGLEQPAANACVGRDAAGLVCSLRAHRSRRHDPHIPAARPCNVARLQSCHTSGSRPMSCCAEAAMAGIQLAPAALLPARELALASRDLGDGVFRTDLTVPRVRCADCIALVEGTLQQLDGVLHARVNLTAHRVSVKWRAVGSAPPLVEVLSGIGYPAFLADADDRNTDPEMAELLRATAVAGFAAMNIMLLSVSIWSGADPATRSTFHWLSALIACPAV